MAKKRYRVADMEVMSAPCSTCPFGGAHRSPLTPESQAYYTEKIVTLQSQHLCHTVNNTKICRGGRDIMLKVLCAMGVLNEPTDAAFNQKRKEILGI